MNEYDSNRIINFTKKVNYVPTKDIKLTDCYILNTCHIREKATEKVYHEVGRLKKQFRNKKKPIVLIVGCVAQAEGDVLLQKEKYIDAVVGPQSYQEINNIIQKLEQKESSKINYTEFETIKKFDQLRATNNLDNKISSFLTIQEGCDKFCKFCVVPYTRGPECSRPFVDIISEANQLVKNGSKEITLLGQNVNAYRFKDKRLSDLLYCLNEIKNLKRIRYTTSHPKDFSEDLFEAHNSCKKLMPLLHLPVQSGSTKILKAMNRNHSIDEYLSIIDKLLIKKPSLKFSSDFIIGYPGETEKDFDQTLSLIKKVGFINSYSYLYSPRPGTPAATLEEVDNSLAKDRLYTFQNLANQIKKDYRKKLVNTKVKVLFENKIGDDNKYFGRDEYYNSVIVHSNQDLSGQIKDINIFKYNHNTLFGEVISETITKEYAA